MRVRAVITVGAFALGWLALGGFAPGCESATRPGQQSESSGKPSAARGANRQAARSLLSSARLSRALDALLSPLPRTTRILSLTVLHRQVILQIQDSDNLSQVSEYRYWVEGKLEGPNPVTLLGSGKLRDNLFPMQAADPNRAVRVLQQVESESQTKNLAIKKLVMIRNLPRSRDIQFNLLFADKEGELTLTADKQGRLLGEPRRANKAAEQP